MSSNSIKYVEEEFSPQNNGELSDSIVQNWTEQAIECYNLNCNCANCSISKGNYSFVCQMPKIIKALLKIHGKPEESPIKLTQIRYAKSNITPINFRRV